MQNGFTIEELRTIKQYYIIGNGRSGTTLLNFSLNNHSQVHCSPEFRFTIAFYKKYHQQYPIDKDALVSDLIRYLNAIYGRARTDNQIWFFNETKFIKALFALGDVNYVEVCKLLSLHLELQKVPPQNVHILVDKNPDYTPYAETLIRLFPETKFIITIRDYRAYVLSNLENQNNKIVNVVYFALLWRKFNQEALRLKAVYPKQVHLHPYETFLAAPKAQMQKLCTFLNIPYEGNLLAHNKKVKINPAQQADANRQVRFSKLSKPLNTSRVAAWQSRLSAKQIALSELISGSTGKALGYETTKNLSRWQKISMYAWHLPQIIVFYVTYYIFVKKYFSIPLAWRVWLIKWLGLNR